MAQKRPAIHAYLSTTADEAWRRITEGSGVSVSALLEVLGPELAADLDADE